MKGLVKVIDETLRIINTGGYSISPSESASDGKVRFETLQLNKVQMSEAIVITEKQVQELIASPKCGGRGAIIRLGQRCGFAVSNTDSDSTGAITGNILGARIEYSNIPPIPQSPSHS